MFELPPSSVDLLRFTLKYPEVIIGGCAIFLKNRFAERHLFLAVCFFARFEGKVRSPCSFTILIWEKNIRSKRKYLTEIQDDIQFHVMK